jgi:periplasmic divalent cation tolerance protein
MASHADAPQQHQPEQVLAVLVTAPDAAVAQRLADAAVGERLAACANVFLGGGAAGSGSGSNGFAVQSTYWWQGKLCRAENETLLLLKTPARNLSRLTARIKELHPYDEPAISALPVVGGSASYLKWVVDEATGEGGGDATAGAATTTGAAAKE